VRQAVEKNSEDLDLAAGRRVVRRLDADEVLAFDRARGLRRRRRERPAGGAGDASEEEGGGELASVHVHGVGNG
jgi:hypothetical protein